MLGTGASASMSKRDRSGKQRALKIQQSSARCNEDTSHRLADPTTQTAKSHRATLTRTPQTTRADMTVSSKHCRAKSDEQVEVQSLHLRLRQRAVFARCSRTQYQRRGCGVVVTCEKHEAIELCCPFLDVCCVSFWCTNTVITRWRLGARWGHVCVPNSCVVMGGREGGRVHGGLREGAQGKMAGRSWWREHVVGSCPRWPVLPAMQPVPFQLSSGQTPLCPQ